MSNRILITPEQLEQVSSQFSQSEQRSSAMVQQLQASISQLEGQWDGVTRERFYADYQQARSEMNKFVECLHNVSMELRQIAVKFRTTDESMSGVGAIAPSVGAGIAAGAGLGAGAAAGAYSAGGAGTAAASSAAGAGGTASKAKEDKDLLKKMWDGGEVDAHMVENKEGGLYANAMNASAGASMTSGAHAGVSVVEAGYENDYVEGSVSLLKGEVEAEIKDGNLSIGAEATLNKYEGGFKIPLPFTDKELNIGGSASLGVVGGSAEVGKNGLSFHLPLGPGASLVGVGGSITVE